MVQFHSKFFILQNFNGIQNLLLFVMKGYKIAGLLPRFTADRNMENYGDWALIRISDRKI